MRTISSTKWRTQGDELLIDLKEEGTALLTDEKGRPAAYLIDSDKFDELQARIQLLEGIARGENAIREGRVVTQAEAKRKMARWLQKK